MRLFEKLLSDSLTRLREAGVPTDDLAAIERATRAMEIAEPDPKIALIGFTGVGKSSTINALFNAGREIGHVRACTQEAAEVHADVQEYTGTQGSVTVFDMPGLGEDEERDKVHLKTYLEVLPRVDVIVWLFHAGDRAMTPMQQALSQLGHAMGDEFTKKLMFGINKVDAIAPGEIAWKSKTNLPSPEQRRNVADFEQYVLDKVHMKLPRWQGAIISYSARRRYKLEDLMTAMVQSAGKRGWVLNDRADVADYSELIDPAVLRLLHERGEELRSKGARPWREG